MRALFHSSYLHGLSRSRWVPIIPCICLDQGLSTLFSQPPLPVVHSPGPSGHFITSQSLFNLASFWFVQYVFHISSSSVVCVCNKWLWMFAQLIMCKWSTRGRLVETSRQPPSLFASLPTFILHQCPSTRVQAYIRMRTCVMYTFPKRLTRRLFLRRSK